MLNDFEIRGDVAVIFLRRNRGKADIETMIDIEDLPIAQSITGRWLVESKNDGRIYVRHMERLTGGNFRQAYLHRLITEAPDGLSVEHINHDGLCNRRQNLRVGKKLVHALHRRGVTKKSRSGLRGVSWSAVTGKWKASVTIHGKRYNLGRHYDKQEAGKAVQSKIAEMRARHDIRAD